MAVFDCDTCGSPVHAFEGDRGILVGTCAICGRGYGGAKSIDTGWTPDTPKEEEVKRPKGYSLYVSHGPDDPEPIFIHTFKAYWMAHDSKQFYMDKHDREWWSIKEEW